MPVFDVVSVEPETRLWEAHGHQFVSYYCVFRDEQGNPQKVEWARKMGGKEPQPGERVIGNLQQTSFGLKFKIDFEATKGLQEQARAESYMQPAQIQGGPTAPVPVAQAPPMPPAQINAGPTIPSPKDQSIARMAAQKVAALFVLAQAQAGMKGEISPKYVAQVADFFEQDARR